MRLYAVHFAVVVHLFPRIKMYCIFEPAYGVGLKSSVFFLVVLCWLIDRLIDRSVGCSVVLRPFLRPRLTS